MHKGVNVCKGVSEDLSISTWTCLVSEDFCSGQSRQSLGRAVISIPVSPHLCTAWGLLSQKKCYTQIQLKSTANPVVSKI